MAGANYTKRTVAGSVGAGMKSIFGGGGRRYYVLEHKVSSQFHRAGEAQRIIVDQIELGRDPRCQVRFDDKFPTVSRRHAAIVKDGDNWKLVQLSRTNSTFLNGRKVENEWYLQNGDEIQLSANGPKLGFIEPAGDKGLVKSIGMTARLSLFRQQALRPYKRALAIVAACLLVGVVAGGWALWDLHQKNQAQAALITANETRHKAEMASRDSLLQQATTERNDLATEVKTLKSQVGRVSGKQRKMSVAAGAVDNNALAGVLRHVYFLFPTRIDVETPDGEKTEINCLAEGAPSWCGTGFLLEDGTFVTARHVIEPWSYWNNGGNTDEFMYALNTVMNNGGRVRAQYHAISSSGSELHFGTQNFSVTKRGDQAGHSDDGFKITLGGLGNTDYAYAKTGKSGGLKFDKAASTNLERGTKLTVLGFPLGLGLHSSSVNPVSSTATVGIDGLERGVILTSETNYEPGCSGGPALMMDSQGNYRVVGIVSAIAGRNTGFIVPLKVVK